MLRTRVGTVPGYVATSVSVVQRAYALCGSGVRTAFPHESRRVGRPGDLAVGRLRFYRYINRTRLIILILYDYYRILLLGCTEIYDKFFFRLSAERRAKLEER